MAATRTARKGRTGKGKKVDSYQVVTDLIVGALEQGVVPWHRPWKSVHAGGEGAPRSLSSRKPYRGINVWTLSVTAMLNGYESPWWGTYKQIAERGGQVRKGEAGTPIVFWRVIEVVDPADALKKKKILLLKHFVVFNADQADDVKCPAGKPDDGEPNDYNPIAECEEIVAGYINPDGPGLKHGGNSACYSPMLDLVRMPKSGQFKTVDHYYGTLFHELGHSTGHADRLNRKTGVVEPAPFGTPDYSTEELVAEMTAAFVCGEAGIDVNVPHRAAYIENWLQVLKGDKKAVVSAAAAAQKAADLILGREPESSGEEAQ